MPPKSASKKKRPNVKPKKPVVVTSDEALRYVETLESAGDVALHALNIIVDRAADVLKRHAIKAQCILDTSAVAWEWSVQAAQLGLMQHDFGEVRKEGSQIITPTGQVYDPVTDRQHELCTIQNWVLEDEPAMCAVDTFGTGVVRTKTRRPRVNHDVVAALEPLAPAPRSPSGLGPRPASRNGRPGSRKGKKKKAEKKPNVPQKIEIMLTEEELKQEKMRVSELKKLDHKKRMIERAVARENEEKAEKARFQKIQNDLKGKNFTYDESGNVVMIRQPAPERLPGLALKPKTELVKEENEDEDEKKNKKRDHGSNKERKPRKKTKKQPPVLNLGRVAFVDAKDLGPDPMTLFKPKKGVTWTVGGNSVAGPTSESSSPKAMTRSEYNEHISSQHGHPPSTYTPVPSKPTSAAGRRSRPTSAGSQSAAAVRASSRPNSGRSQIPQSPLNATGALTGSIAELPPPVTLNNLAISKPRFGSANTPPLYDPDDEEDDFNNSIMKDPSWGNTHNVVPEGEKLRRMPSNPLSPAQRSQMRDLTLDKRARLPRDRQYVEKVTGQRRHLPPPIYPASSGHGMMDSVTLPYINNKSLTASNSVPDLKMKTSHRSELGRIKLESGNRQMF